jgi:hypothetical protein
MSKLKRRDIIAGIHAVIAVIILIGTVSAAHFLVGLSGFSAVGVGGLVGYAITRTILRYLVPEVPVVNDVERLQIRVGRRWLIWTVVMTPFFYFATSLSWVGSLGVAIGSGLIGWAIEHRKRRQARARLANRS